MRERGGASWHMREVFAGHEPMVREAEQGSRVHAGLSLGAEGILRAGQRPGAGACAARVLATWCSRAREHNLRWGLLCMRGRKARGWA